MVGQLARGRSGDRLPGGTTVGAAVKALASVGHAYIDRLAAGARAAAVGVEGDKADPYAAGGPGDREAGDLAPGRGEVGAAPQPVVAGAQVEGGILVGVDRHALAHGAPGLIAAEFERQVGPLEARTLVGGAQDRAVSGPVVGVGA